MLCVSAFHAMIHAENESNPTVSSTQEQSALFDQLNPSSVHGIRFAFEITRREEFDQKIWQKLTLRYFRSSS